MIYATKKQAYHHCPEGPQWSGDICPSKEIVLTYHMPSFFLISEQQWLNNVIQLISEYEHMKSFWETVIWLSVLRENYF